jgi:hypothetical protein
LFASGAHRSSVPVFGQAKEAVPSGDEGHARPRKSLIFMIFSDFSHTLEAVGASRVRLRFQNDFSKRQLRRLLRRLRARTGRLGFQRRRRHLRPNLLQRNRSFTSTDITAATTARCYRNQLLL